MYGGGGWTRRQTSKLLYMMANTTGKVCVTVFLGCVFVTLGSCRYFIIKLSANEEGRYDYLPVTVNVCAELIKLTVCGLMALKLYISEGRSLNLLPTNRQTCIDLLKWSVPGFLYFCDNLLTFFIVKYFQPAVVVLLGNFVIITTSILFRLILQRSLSKIQWASLVILFLAIVTLSNQSQGSVTSHHHRHHAVDHIVLYGNKTTSFNQIQHDQFECNDNTNYNIHYSSILFNSSHLTNHKLANTSPDDTQVQTKFSIGHIFILAQCLISSLANIYNEKIFKEGDGLKESIYIQNCKLYLFGVLFNIMGLVIHGVYRNKVIHCGFFNGHNSYSVILMFVTAMYGLNVALILKFRDNMFHLMSTQMITVTVICASVFFFGFKPQLEFFLMAPVVVMAIYIFNTSKQSGSDWRTTSGVRQNEDAKRSLIEFQEIPPD